MKKKEMIIAIDFDGTIVTHHYPAIGKPVKGAIEAIKQMQSWGHKIILYTMRSGKELQEAIDYCQSVGIKFWGVNENPEQKNWTDSPKIYANLYIDDAAYGIPLDTHYLEDQPFVNWSNVLNIFSAGGS